MFRWLYDKNIEFSKGGFIIVKNVLNNGNIPAKVYMNRRKTIKFFIGHMTSISANKILNKYV